MKYKGKEVQPELVPIVEACNRTLGEIAKFLIKVGEKQSLTIQDKFDILILGGLSDKIMSMVAQLLDDRNMTKRVQQKIKGEMP